MFLPEFNERAFGNYSRIATEWIVAIPWPNQTSVCSAISKASSISIPIWRTFNEPVLGRRPTTFDSDSAPNRPSGRAICYLAALSGKADHSHGVIIRYAIAQRVEALSGLSHLVLNFAFNIDPPPFFQ
jgi:hypothetical protein